MPKASPRSGGRTSAAAVRCAIYTRKSSEEGLEQDFNSLHAQREACEAYIRSQKHEGWTGLPARYDDGGISGASMQRPALQRLLADIRAGKVDTVVVYKVDRLTRSLADFAKIVEIFDASGVAFVSVTQQFNTTSSMGRLTLNVLLSFAQFEREVTGERIRDKIAASKQKGMWMGGCPPLGYDAHERTLRVNESEAATVRHIFQRYIALGSVGALQEELARDGITSKRWVSRSGRTHGGVALARGALYHLLGNRLYLGEIVHKDRQHPGQHPPIIDRELWGQAQHVLAGNLRARRRGRPVKHGNLLTGLLHDAAGRRMSPTFAVKAGQRYRYYVSLPRGRGEQQGNERSLRLPAGELEQLVGERLCQFLADGSAVLDAVAASGTTGGASAGDQADLIGQASMLARSWSTLAPDQQRQIIMALIARIDACANSILIHVVPRAISLLTMDDSPGQGTPDGALTVRPQQDPESHPSGQDAGRHTVVLTVSLQQLRIGQGHKLIVPGSSGAAGDPNPALVKLVVRAHHLRQQVLGATKADLKSAARELGLNHSYVTRLLRLAWLAPDITQAILDGTQPTTLTAERLVRHTASLPIAWQGQRELLGFR